MGLFDKTNPRATGRSVIRWAIFGAIAFPVLTSVRLRLTAWPWPNRYSLPILIAVAVAGAGIGALMEWQLDDGDVEDKGANPDPLRASGTGIWTTYARMPGATSDLIVMSFRGLKQQVYPGKLRVTTIGSIYATRSISRLGRRRGYIQVIAPACVTPPRSGFLSLMVLWARLVWRLSAAVTVGWTGLRVS